MRSKLFLMYSNFHWKSQNSHNFQRLNLFIKQRLMFTYFSEKLSKNTTISTCTYSKRKPNNSNRYSKQNNIVGFAHNARRPTYHLLRITFERRFHDRIYNISGKTSCNISKLFIWIRNELLNHRTFAIIERLTSDSLSTTFQSIH